MAIGDPFRCTEDKIPGLGVRCESAFMDQENLDVHIQQFHPSSLRASDMMGSLRDFEAVAEAQREEERRAKKYRESTERMLEEVRRRRLEEERLAHEATLPKKKVKPGVLDRPKPVADVGAPHKPARRVVRA